MPTAVSKRSKQQFAIHNESCVTTGKKERSTKVIQSQECYKNQDAIHPYPPPPPHHAGIGPRQTPGRWCRLAYRYLREEKDRLTIRQGF